MKLNYKRTFFVGLAFLSISAFWQMYDNIIPLMLQNSFGFKETITGVLMAMDNVLAIFLLPVFGALSDKTNTKIGRRMPFILVGTVLAVIFMMMLPMADHMNSAAMFLIALFALLFSMGIYRSPAVALMPDLTPNRCRSKANAVINLMGAVGSIYSLIAIKFLVGKGDRPDYAPMFISIAALMVLAVVILFFAIPENKTRDDVAAKCRAANEPFNAETEEEAALRENETAGRGKTDKDAEELRENETAGCGTTDKDAEELRENETAGRGNTDKDAAASGQRIAGGNKMEPAVRRSMIFLLASIFLWYFAYNAVTTAFSRYTKVVWKMEGGGFANCLLVGMVTAVICFIPIGIISGKIGRKKMILIGIVLMSVSYLAGIFVHAYTPFVNVLFGVIGIGWASINVNSYPMVVEMAKGSDIGKYTGTYYTFSMASQIVTPIVSGFLLEHISYSTLFPYAFIFSVLAFATMTQVRHGDIFTEKTA